MKRLGWAVVLALAWGLTSLPAQDPGEDDAAAAPPAASEAPAQREPAPAAGNDLPLDDLLPAPAPELPPPSRIPPGASSAPDDAASASDRPLTNLDPPVADRPPEPAGDPGASAHQPYYPPARPHGYDLPDRRRDEAREAIQRRAEFKAAQRGKRIATMKWFGYSNARPSASAAPFMGTYSPSWIGNGGLPSYWSGANGWSTPVRVVQ
ncbi:MAG: hypothetical protein U0935_22590 [Pirellulales bacterium]